MDGSQPPPPRRRPADGGYARGLETRERIIQAAFLVFAEEGYVGASTRRIAAEAGVNPPALQYYFDSKEGLHRACGQFIVDKVTGQLQLSLDRAREALQAGRTEVVDALCQLIEDLAVVAMANAESQAWSRFMGRCETDNIGPAAAMVEAGVATPLKEASTGLLARALGLDPNGSEAKLRSILLLSPITAFHAKRESVLAMMGWSDFTGDNIDVIRKALSDHVRRLLASPDS